MDRRMEVEEEDVTSAEYYRARAAAMLEQARHAPNDEIKLSCLSLAQSWETLAAHAERTRHILSRRRRQGWYDEAELAEEAGASDLAQNPQDTKPHGPHRNQRW
jgi:hypothetical protein